MNQFEHHKAVWEIRNFIQKINLYVQEQAPWKYKESSDMGKLQNVIYNCLYATHCATFYLSPVMPTVAEQIMDVLDPSERIEDPTELFGKIVYQFSNPEIPFQKIEQIL